MKRLRFCSKFLGYAAMAMLLSNVLSCGTKESIEPTYAPVSIDEQLESRPVEVSLNIDDFDIEEFGKDFAEVSELGPLFQGLAEHLANIAIAKEGGQVVDIEPIIYYANELDQVKDWSYFRRLGIKKININIQDSEDLELASLDFIEEVKIYVDFKEPELEQVKRKEGEGILIASFTKSIDEKRLGCSGKCISLVIEDIDWIEILKKERTFTIYPELKVNKVPKVKMSVGGEVGIFVGLKFGI